MPFDEAALEYTALPRRVRLELAPQDHPNYLTWYLDEAVSTMHSLDIVGVSFRGVSDVTAQLWALNELTEPLITATGLVWVLNVLESEPDKPRAFVLYSGDHYFPLNIDGVHGVLLLDSLGGGRDGLNAWFLHGTIEEAIQVLEEKRGEDALYTLYELTQ